MIFIDSNMPMYVAGRDHPLREPARRFLERIRGAEIEGCTSTEVLQEILYGYMALKRPDLAGQVYDLFVQLCPVVFPVTLADTDRAKGLVVGQQGVGARDAIHAAVMFNDGVSRIATFDADFDSHQGNRARSPDITGHFFSDPTPYVSPRRSYSKTHFVAEALEQCRIVPSFRRRLPR